MATKEPKDLARVVAKMTVDAADARWRQTLIDYTAECVVQGFTPQIIAGMVWEEFGKVVSAKEVSQVKHKWLKPYPERYEEASRRIASGATTRGSKKPATQSAEAPAARAGEGAPVVDRSRARLVRGWDGNGREDDPGGKGRSYAERARDREEFLNVVARLMFTSVDEKIVIQAASVVGRLCGHQEQQEPDTEALRAEAESAIREAMQSSGCDRETAILEISKRIPGFERWVR